MPFERPATTLTCPTGHDPSPGTAKKVATVTSVAHRSSFRLVRVIRGFFDRAAILRTLSINDRQGTERAVMRANDLLLGERTGASYAPKHQTWTMTAAALE
ncbi:hypothetical protein AXG93_4188s1080 [Marchantia polymorpha subsp. ruderalis]|uniref:Uncharacterized protein n=1 Tax=Marchantia polymorpha subsp. ruderalis TaxID=1480154 RepID=A0A176WDM1_MARPO|nr:hypothetical protein AXG93_4188s1080 [Marchantia polymorpha subsp. ruderalis]